MQKVVKYLGYIAEQDISSLPERIRFWKSVDDGLDALRLDEERRRTIEEKIEATVPYPQVQKMCK